jgi:hypothetical protein
MTNASLLGRVGSRLKRFIKLAMGSSTVKQATPKADEWSIGIYFGTSPYAFLPEEVTSNPVLTRRSVTDVVAAYVADPFMAKVNGTWYMFFEVMNKVSGKGEIGVATSLDGEKWTYQRIVLNEPFHLSYPYIFQWSSQWYMVPESNAIGAIRLYKADPFPTAWKYVKDLIPNCNYADPSPVYFNENWWLFASSGKTKRQADNLHIFHAKDLYGTWKEHVLSPIVRDNAEIARPAGRILSVGDKLIRYTQDCRVVYGHQVRAFLIEKINVDEYLEKSTSNATVVRADLEAWNETGMHHVDAHRISEQRWMACVDGWRWVTAAENLT